MRSIDKLREYGARFNNSHDAWSGIGCEILEIADEIEREVAEVRDREYRNGMEDGEMAAERDGWVRLPVDADGVPINVGDVLDGYGKTIEVVELRIGRSGWVIVSRDGNAYVDCAAFTHRHVPTVEDVLREFACGLGVPVADSYVAATAAKLRLAGDE